MLDKIPGLSSVLSCTSSGCIVSIACFNASRSLLLSFISGIMKISSISFPLNIFLNSVIPLIMVCIFNEGCGMLIFLKVSCVAASRDGITTSAPKSSSRTCGIYNNVPLVNTAVLNVPCCSFKKSSMMPIPVCNVGSPDPEKVIYSGQGFSFK
jgi:hypothetical protein